MYDVSCILSRTCELIFGNPENQYLGVKQAWSFLRAHLTAIITEFTYIVRLGFRCQDCEILSFLVQLFFLAIFSHLRWHCSKRDQQPCMPMPAMVCSSAVLSSPSSLPFLLPSLVWMDLEFEWTKGDEWGQWPYRTGAVILNSLS